MPKEPTRYLDVDPFLIRETGFHPERNMVSESIFSIGNEYTGIRGFFDEGSSLPSLVGTYYNGIIEQSLEETPNAYKGIIKRGHFTINSTNWLKIRLTADSKKLDLKSSKVESFVRTLDMHTGLMERSFDWLVAGARVACSFKRIVNMSRCHEGVQELSFESDKEITLHLTLFLDGNILHWGGHCYWDRVNEFKRGGSHYGLTLKTPTTHQSLTSLMRIDSPILEHSYVTKEREIGVNYYLKLKPGERVSITRYAINIANKHTDQEIDDDVKRGRKELDVLLQKGLSGVISENKAYFDRVWKESDIEIEGNDLDQQGIRFCIFQLEQAYHGYEEDNNIGAKGLTGEAYSGHAFWDSETYCLPYFLFGNPKAAKDLLMFRYNTLPEAKQRALDLDCEGACYPIATRNGKEACNLWQHASTQLQPTTAVAYAIFHYMNLYSDQAFMQEYGLEMLMEICRFLFTRGQYNQDGTRFGYYGVMGPDEFEVMVNHNAYTNFMAKKTFQYLFSILSSGTYDLQKLFKKCGYSKKLVQDMAKAVERMVILYDPNTKLFEQHEGFYDLPHIDVKKIPVTDFPLYSHWTYDRIYRNDIIKQPDVLMFMFLYPSDFSLEQKEANYDYYEPRCIHESSLSPSIHSIIASELGKEQEAMDFFGFATRLDLDDYNRNTSEGLHMTSIAAAWMNIVYGFLGLRSDRTMLSIYPSLPSSWESYGVHLLIKGTKVAIKVKREELVFSLEGEPIELMVYGKILSIKDGAKVRRG